MQVIHMQKGVRFFSSINYTDYNYLHAHDFWELILVFNGTYLEQINGKNVTLQRNTLSVVRPSDEHSMQALAKNVGELKLQVEKTTFKNVFSSLEPNLYLSLLSPDYVSFSISERAKQNLVSLAVKLQSENLEKTEREVVTSQLFVAFMQEILEFYRNPNAVETDRFPDRISQITMILNDKENVNKTLQEALAELNYSYVHLSRLFKKYMKVTLSQYFTSVKLTHARILLENTSMRVIDVASAVGYYSAPHFNTAFRKRFGVSPAKYRKHWRENLQKEEETK